MSRSPKTWAEARELARKSAEAMTPAEEAEIQAAIDADPDNPELTDEDFARMAPSRPLGRPTLPEEQRRKQITFRWSPETIEGLRALGPGWGVFAEKVVRKALQARHRSGSKPAKKRA